MHEYQRVGRETLHGKRIGKIDRLPVAYTLARKDQFVSAQHPRPIQQCTHIDRRGRSVALEFHSLYPIHSRDRLHPHPGNDPFQARTGANFQTRSGNHLTRFCLSLKEHRSGIAQQHSIRSDPFRLQCTERKRIASLYRHTYRIHRRIDDESRNLTRFLSAASKKSDCKRSQKQCFFHTFMFYGLLFLSKDHPRPRIRYCSRAYFSRRFRNMSSAICSMSY